MAQFTRYISILLTLSLAFSQDPEALLEQGESQLSAGDILSAEASFLTAIQADPTFAPAMQSMSKLYLHKGDLKKANEYSIQAVQADEDFREWATQIGKISEQIQNGNRFVQQHQYDEAIGEYNKILKAHPYFPDAEFYKGLTRFRQKDIDKAALHFANALKIYPEHPKARKGLDNVTKQFLNAGNKSYKRGDLGKAKSYYEKALNFDSNFYLAYFQLGVLEKKQGNSKSAISFLNKVLEIKPDHEKTWFTIGTAYESDGKFDDALGFFEQALLLNQDDPDLWNYKGITLRSLGRYEEAMDCFNKSLKIDPRDRHSS